MKIPNLMIRATELAVRAESLPDGVCGIITGIALRYGVTDSWGTRFRPGCVDKTRAKIAARKVKLFANHGFADQYGIRTHIGTVTSFVTAGDAEVMTAELFDTEEGRHAKAYLEAVQKSRAETGLSIGFNPREGEWVGEGDNKHAFYEYAEIELEETSLAPRQAVPGATVTGVRHAPNIDDARLLMRGLRAVYSEEQLLSLIRETDTSATDGDEPGDDGQDRTAVPPEKTDAGDEPAAERSALASPEQRAQVLRELITL